MSLPDFLNSMRGSRADQALELLESLGVNTSSSHRRLEATTGSMREVSSREFAMEFLKWAAAKPGTEYEACYEFAGRIHDYIVKNNLTLSKADSTEPLYPSFGMPLLGFLTIMSNERANQALELLRSLRVGASEEENDFGSSSAEARLISEDDGGVYECKNSEEKRPSAPPMASAEAIFVDPKGGPHLGEFLAKTPTAPFAEEHAEEKTSLVRNFRMTHELSAIGEAIEIKAMDLDANHPSVTAKQRAKNFALRKNGVEKLAREIIDKNINLLKINVEGLNKDQCEFFADVVLHLNKNEKHVDVSFTGGPFKKIIPRYAVSSMAGKIKEYDKYNNRCDENLKKLLIFVKKLLPSYFLDEIIGENIEAKRLKFDLGFVFISDKFSLVEIAIYLLSKKEAKSIDELKNLLDRCNILAQHSLHKKAIIFQVISLLYEMNVAEDDSLKEKAQLLLRSLISNNVHSYDESVQGHPRPRTKPIYDWDGNKKDALQYAYHLYSKNPNLLNTYKMIQQELLMAGFSLFSLDMSRDPCVAISALVDGELDAVFSQSEQEQLKIAFNIRHPQLMQLIHQLQECEHEHLGRTTQIGRTTQKKMNDKLAALKTFVGEDCVTTLVNTPEENEHGKKIYPIMKCFSKDEFLALLDAGANINLEEMDLSQIYVEGSGLYCEVHQHKSFEESDMRSKRIESFDVLCQKIPTILIYRQATNNQRMAEAVVVAESVLPAYNPEARASSALKEG
jgi:hypothetical protein